MSIEELRIKEVQALRRDYRTLSIAEQQANLFDLRDVVQQAAFYGMFGFDEALDAFMRAALMRGIERGRGTDQRWDDTQWLEDEVTHTYMRRVP